MAAPEQGARILVCGALHLDVVVSAPRMPALDETLAGHAVAYRFGGKGGNQAVAAARMGASVAMAGAVGSDRFGADLIAVLDAASVDRGLVRRHDGASGMSVAIVDQAGDYGAVIVSGVNREIDPDRITIPDRLDWLLLQNEVPEAVNLALARRLPGEVRLLLNAAPARPIASALLQRTDLLVANRVEAAMLVGGTAGRLDTAAAAAAAALCALGPRAAIVTAGGGGLACCTADGGGFTQPGFEVPVVSSHGAGDAFIGALAARAGLPGADLPAACRFAQAAAALHVSAPEARRGEIDVPAVRAFLAGAASGP